MDVDASLHQVHVSGAHGAFGPSWGLPGGAPLNLFVFVPMVVLPVGRWRRF